MGARQVGKTWAMKEFGKMVFKKVAYLVLENNENLEQLFNWSLHPKDLLPFLSAAAGVDIDPKDTLIIFDEIQAIPNALTALKFFYEEAPEYHIISAGSTLWVTLHKSGSFPVGKVDFMHLHPMDFLEFLGAMGEEQLVELMKKEIWEKINIFHDKLDRYLKQYYFVGGMPEAVASYATEKNFEVVREIQKRIVNSYEQDFSKYATPLMATKLRMLYNSIPHQISKENKKFIYGIVKQWARARDYETVIQWLLDSGLVIKVNRVKTPKEPLKVYEDFGAFKLFVHDIWILGALVNSKAMLIVEQDTIYTEFKWALSEQFVCQELYTAGIPLFYWSSEDSKQEIDFLIENENWIIPIEVKSGTHLSATSFTEFMKKYKSKFGLKLSRLPYKASENVINFPLYLAGEIHNI